MQWNSQWALNQRVERVTTDTLVVGMDMAKEFAVAQAATCRGVVLSRHALRVSHAAAGFAHLLKAVRQWQAPYPLPDVIVGRESTGHYWWILAHRSRPGGGPGQCIHLGNSIQKGSEFGGRIM